MSQWKKTSTSSQTDSNYADSPPGHKLPGASDHIPRRVRPITGHHARSVVDQDVCVCIACRTHCRNNDALRKHGEGEGHHPYGCVCGDAFNRLDALERHIASKNKDVKVNCCLCGLGQAGQAAKGFSRSDHLQQHLRTYHKIPAGRIPEDFIVSSASNASAGRSMPPPPSLPSFPCSIPGCAKVAELAYTRQMDLDEHMFYVHNVPQKGSHAQQGPIDPVPAWTNNPYMRPAEMLGQYAQQNGPWQQDLAGVAQTCWGPPEANIPASDLTFRTNDGFGSSSFNFEAEDNFGV